ncbi:MAG: YdcH family protein [Hyphomicrobiaceae bacterium]
MDVQEEKLLRQQLGELRNKHRELDEQLAQIEVAAAHDQITLTRLKKQKLQLKDQIIQLEDRLFPDIIA